MSKLPSFVSRDAVAQRLPLIFPEGTPNRGYCIRELSASTVFTALYIGAVESSGQYMAPKHVYRMTAEQAQLTADEDRREYGENAAKPRFGVPGARWYADNTREPIRDETLREGLVAVGAVIVKDDLPTTSGKPRYALKADFARLFDPSLNGSDLSAAIEAFQSAHLSKAAFTRMAFVRAGASARSDSAILATFPNGETRLLSAGPSSVIARAVVEKFAIRFLAAPAVLWLSESGKKVVARDEALARSIGLEIAVDRNLPDLILVDLGPKEPLIVFLEVVATDGAITERRKDALLALTDHAGFARSQVCFVTAYADRESASFKKTVSGLAWNSFAWFVSEPDQILIMRDGDTLPVPLSKLIAP